MKCKWCKYIDDFQVKMIYFQSDMWIEQFNSYRGILHSIWMRLVRSIWHSDRVRRKKGIKATTTIVIVILRIVSWIVGKECVEKYWWELKHLYACLRVWATCETIASRTQWKVYDCICLCRRQCCKLNSSKLFGANEIRCIKKFGFIESRPDRYSNSVILKSMNYEWDARPQIPIRHSFGFRSTNILKLWLYPPRHNWAIFERVNISNSDIVFVCYL